MSWEDVTLEDLVLLQRGFDITKAQQKDGIVPVISSSGPQSFHNIAKVKGPGVVIGRKGTLGSVYYSKADYWPHDTTLWSKDLKGNNAKFVAYFLQTMNLARFDTGASNPTLNRNHIHGLPIKKPDLPTQKRIVSFLSAYDDLIENNRRRIALLEQAARLLYREWFVHFRFPGHETAKFVDGLPEGWELRSLIAMAEITMGQSPKSEFYNDRGEGLPFHQGVTNYGFRFVEDKMFSTVTTKLANAGDILFSVRAPVGRINYTLNKIVLGRGLSAFKSATGHQSFLFYCLKNHFFKEDLIGGGAIYAATNKKELENLEVLYPTAKLVDEFDSKAQVIDAQIKALILQNAELTRARDLLLPRLMDGRISI